MAYRFAICNQKGGVAKTTTCLSLGACLAEMGYRTLLLDLDPQANLTLATGINHELVPATLADVFTGMTSDKGAKNPRRAIQHTKMEGLDILPADPQLSIVERNISETKNYQGLLGQVIDDIQSDYRFVLLDCSPSLGPLTIMALTAVCCTVVPVQCEFFAAWGLMQLIETITTVRERTNPKLEYHLLATMYDQRNSISREILERFKEKYPGKLLNTVIGIDTHLKESVISGEPIILFAPRTRASQQYRELATELLEKLNLLEE
jgi:chromosome partitioning protein